MKSEGEAPAAALTIGGSDNSTGAGIQADLKTFSAFGVYGLTAVTCIVAEVPGKVSSIQLADPAIVTEQMRLSFEAFPVGAVKTGMLSSRAIIEAVCHILRGITPRPPLVVDPVMVATSGQRLLQPDAIEGYRTDLFPLAEIITPNLDEVTALTGREVRSATSMREAAQQLRDEFGVGVLVKGGHLPGEEALDLLFWEGEFVEYAAPFVPGIVTHGTGCAFSAAIAAGRAQGVAMPQAVERAKKFVTGAIRNHFRWKRDGNVTDALNHLSVATG